MYLKNIKSSYWVTFFYDNIIHKVKKGEAQK